ncbi:hypothetical protein RB195_015842 [Necator americanus]
MIYKVVSELDSFFSNRLPQKLSVRIIDTLCAYASDNNLTTKIRLSVYIGVILLILLHLMLTCLCLYGTYASRPAFMRPFIFDVVISFAVLLLFVCFCILISWQLTSRDYTSSEDIKGVYLRKAYVGAAFLLPYLGWVIVSIMAYLDTKKLHADFMYWVVEEKINMKANASSDLRSDRSSKGSRTSRVSSHTSHRSTGSTLQQMKSASVDVVETRVAVARTKLSVPL